MFFSGFGAGCYHLSLDDVRSTLLIVCKWRVTRILFCDLSCWLGLLCLLVAAMSLCQVTRTKLVGMPCHIYGTCTSTTLDYSSHKVSRTFTNVDSPVCCLLLSRCCLPCHSTWCLRRLDASILYWWVVGGFIIVNYIILMLFEAGTYMSACHVTLSLYKIGVFSPPIMMLWPVPLEYAVWGSYRGPIWAPCMAPYSHGHFQLLRHWSATIRC